ncbi:hypothetical protein PM082_000670 [Marasmius tenuissimus]|nr:hypothetical protein PM082_000670 [Marasmius tenuissimus]
MDSSPDSAVPLYACMAAAKALSVARILADDAQRSRIEVEKIHLSGVDVDTYAPVAKQLARLGDNAGVSHEERYEAQGIED